MREYRTVQGDTWDLIAYKYYEKSGRELMVSEVIGNNPEYIDEVIFSAGSVIELPDAESGSMTLPPWMR